ncbi:rhodanese-like domain-containing protein [Streptomyces sp. NPDC005438]|uniref:rhodanese-like domain-containing protein n=1 Tax=Streptomyces sp. NPDC005438 TaxID=3156880 RepID=UPI0033B48593
MSGIEELLASARSELGRRLHPHEAHALSREGGLLVDIRYASLRERDGVVPEALIVERNELEWRLDPLGSHRVAQAVDHEVAVVVLCNEGYASSLAALSLRRLGLRYATDLVGGFQAWRAAGLPVTAGPGRVAPPVVAD